MISAIRPTERHALAVVLLAFLVAGCAGAPQNDDGFQFDAGSRMLTVAFHGIHDKFIEPVPMSDVAEGALRRLSTLDGEVGMARDGDQIRLTDRGEVIASAAAPDDDDPDGWAQVTTSLVVAAENQSPAVAAASAEDVYSQLMRGALKPLDSLSRYADARAARRQRATREGYGGIGAQISVDSRGVVIS
jgi:carboxyl-terminal processing protease